MNQKWVLKIKAACVMSALMALMAAPAFTQPESYIESAFVYDNVLNEWTLKSGNHQVIDHECNDIFEYPVLTAWDACDGDISANLIRGGDEVQPDVLGSYIVTYNALDFAGNPADEATRTIQVIDTLAPIITVFGSNPVIVMVGTVYEDAGATAFDACEGDLSTGIVTDTSAVNTNAAGTYTVTYNVQDTSSNAAETATRTVEVVTTSVPLAVAPLPNIALAEGATYAWNASVTGGVGTIYYQWRRLDGAVFVDVVDGVYDTTGEYSGAQTSSLGFVPFTASMAGQYQLEVWDDVDVIQVTAYVELQADSPLPVGGMLGLLVAAFAVAAGGAATLKRHQRQR